MSVNLKQVRFDIANPLLKKNIHPDAKIEGDLLKMCATGYIPNARYDCPLDVEVTVDKSGLFSMVLIDSHDRCTLNENNVLLFNRSAVGWHIAVVRRHAAFIYNVYRLDAADMEENIRQALDWLESYAMETFFFAACKK